MPETSIQLVDPDVADARLTCVAKIGTWRKVAAALETAQDAKWDREVGDVLHSIQVAVRRIDKTVSEELIKANREDNA